MDRVIKGIRAYNHDDNYLRQVAVGWALARGKSGWRKALRDTRGDRGHGGDRHGNWKAMSSQRPRACLREAGEADEELNLLEKALGIARSGAKYQFPELSTPKVMSG